MGTRHRVACLLWVLAWAARPAAAASDIVAIVSAESKVAELSRSQVADLFLGRTRRFPDGSEAVPIDQPEGSATRDEFYEEFAGKSAAQVKAHWSKIIFTGRGTPPAVLANSKEVRKRVAADPAAIGYVERWAVDETVRVLSR